MFRPSCPVPIHRRLITLQPPRSAQSRRVAVPEPLWARLADDWMRAWKERETPGEGEDGSPPALPPPPACFTPECQQCLAESESLAAASKVASQQRQPARSVLACLTEHPPPLREVAVGEALALVPAAFMHAWRAWVKVTCFLEGGGKRGAYRRCVQTNGTVCIFHNLLLLAF